MTAWELTERELFSVSLGTCVFSSSWTRHHSVSSLLPLCSVTDEWREFNMDLVRKSWFFASPSERWGYSCFLPLLRQPRTEWSNTSHYEGYESPAVLILPSPSLICGSTSTIRTAPTRGTTIFRCLIFAREDWDTRNWAKHDMRAGRWKDKREVHGASSVELALGE